MKKKTKIIIIVSILLIIIIFLLAMYILNKYETYILIIESIKDDYVIAYSPVNMMSTRKQDTPIYDSERNTVNISDIEVGDNVFVYTEENKEIQSAIVKRIDNDTGTFTVEMHYANNYYIISMREAQNAIIIDDNGEKIGSSELDIGDSIFIINKIPKIRDYFEGKLEEVELIKVLNNNLDNTP